MATYKPTPRGVADPPRVNQRIDGTIYTYNRQTNTLNGWSYPKPNASKRFQTVNGNALRLDQMFNDLTPTQQAAWDAFFDMDFWQLVCWIWDEDQLPVDPDSPALASFRAVNLARIDQGLTIINSPPSTSGPFPADHVDFFTPQWKAEFFITHTPDPHGYYWQLYGRPASTQPTRGPQPDKALQYITTMNIIPFHLYDLASVLSSSGIYGTAPWKQLEIRLGVRGDVPRQSFSTSA